MIEIGKAAERWAQLAPKRSEVLSRAERAAKLTIPSLLPPEGHTEGSTLPTPYQSFGAKAVNNLSSKIILALFPPNTSFFKLDFDDIAKAEIAGQDVDLDEANKALSKIEQSVVSKLEQTSLRPVVSQVAKHLVVTGNAVIDVMPTMNFRFFSLRHYVVNRDPEGSVIELILKEQVSPLTLSKEILDACFDLTEQAEFSTSPDRTVDLYTVMQRDGGAYKVFQEVNEKIVPGSDTGSYPLQSPRFVVLRWTSIVDEDYGRGLVDEYYGDLDALNNMARDMQKASSLAAKVVFTTDPNSHITPKKLEEAESGDVLRGKSDDVGTISIDKLQDFRIVLDRMRDIQRDLSEAFLMNSSVQRDAERVTAEEIRFMIQELEDSLGGVYAVLAQDLQVPLLRRVLHMLGAKGLIPKLPSKGLKLSITTGLDALGRGHEINKLIQFIRAARETVGEQELLIRLDAQGILNSLAAGFGINTDGLVRSEDEVTAEQQRMQQQALAQAAGPGVAQELVKQGGQQNG